jgi:amino acid transporter/nucleotide-binding universal stress UspA family protein
VIIVSSVMFTFISYWRTAAVVLCDLASTAYYIGGVVEPVIGAAAPWFILAVMLFSYAVRSVYLESCSLFVRGGVYRVVKEAMGGFLAKLSVSALMFDYILTGPASGVSAGKYIMGLGFRFLELTNPTLYAQSGLIDSETRDVVARWGAVLIASLITLYFFRQNLLGIHESSDKAVKIMIATTVMAAIMLGWCGVTLVMKGGPVNHVPWQPDLDRKVELKVVKVRDAETGEEAETWVKDVQTGRLVPERDEQDRPVPKRSESLAKVGIKAQDDPLGFLGRLLPEDVTRPLRQPAHWLSFIGVIGLFIAFGHSILAMSGEETLAQVYREVESPKMPNFKKAAFIIFVYSLVLTAGISFLAVLLIPDSVRMKDYSDNLIGGLARYVVGPPWARLGLEAFVVIVGFLILSGAVNTAIIGSNGVLNRVAEDGVLPDWFLKPHPRYGTTYRVLFLILFLQLATVLVSRGDMIVLGEAYAFGVVWSFVFKAMAMVVLRFKDRSPREFKVPLNLRLAGVEVPIGLSAIFLVLLGAALANLLTKEVATVGGAGFTLVFLTVFMISERFHEKRRRGAKHEHLEQFNEQTAEAVTPGALGVQKLYRKLVAIRSPQNLYMLDKALEDTDPMSTDVVVMTAKLMPAGESSLPRPDLDDYDQHLMTAVVQHAEKAGKQVKPLIVPTNNPLYAIARTAKDLGAQELVVGASNKYTADEQLDQIALYWLSLHEGNPAPLTVRLLGRERDVHLDLAGGSRIPKLGERKARSVAELRAAGLGVQRVLLAHDNTQEGSDLFRAILTMLDPQVALGLVPLAAKGQAAANGNGTINQDIERARQLGRKVELLSPDGDDQTSALVRLAREGKYDLVVVGVSSESINNQTSPVDNTYLLRHSPCRVFLSAPPAIPQEPEQ